LETRIANAGEGRVWGVVEIKRMGSSYRDGHIGKLELQTSFEVFYYYLYYSSAVKAILYGLIEPIFLTTNKISSS